mgnify:CR=1 FL=1
MEKVYLKVPNINELHFRKEWLNNPDTMSYNAGFDLDIKGYDKNTGTITLTDEELFNWYHRWINHEPDRYYAYIYSESINEPIGEIYYYPDNETHSMGILIDYKYRGKGYSYEALIELEKIAFEKNNINELLDEFPLSRESAIKTFTKAGFIITNNDKIEKIFNKETIIKQLQITKEMYYKKEGK